MFERRGMIAGASTVLSPTTGSGHGLTAYYCNNTSFQGSPATIRTERQIKYDTGFLSTFGAWGPGTSQFPLPPLDAANEPQSVVYDGTITAPKTGAYRLALSGYGDATLTLDGRQ